ncbi:unnamed protein product [Heterobilharzia americana]|nr:unnamed protein product [Heterobilharzia americana]
MDARNLSTVIAPNLMRSSSTSKDPRELLQNVRPQTLFIRLLINYLDIENEVKYLKTEEQDDEEEEEKGKKDIEIKTTHCTFHNNGDDDDDDDDKVEEKDKVAESRCIQVNENNNNSSISGKLSSTSNGYMYLSSPIRVKLGPDNAFIPI